MALHGLDRAAAPPAAKAKAMLREIDGTWWNVYIGGPRSGGSGWTPDRVDEYVAQGITRFLLTYVGRQVIPPRGIDDARLLTASQGRRDGDEACRIAARFGYGAGTPICLDLELSTFEASNRRSLDYVCGWCRAVRGHGLRPGVYANISALIPLDARDDRPDWVWVAKWVKHKFNRDVDPHRIPGLANNLFSKPGQRAWQYAGEFAGIPVRVGGLDVDLNVADSGCLAGIAAASAVSAVILSQEDLSIVDEATKKYLDEQFGLIRGRVDRAVQRIGGRRNTVYNDDNEHFQGLVMAQEALAKAEEARKLAKTAVDELTKIKNHLNIP
jgi:Domain of unknown function (DUF1906)